MLKVENLSVALGGATVLENVSFSVQKGEYVCIVGENGGGKSTLLRAILGQVPRAGGTVTLTEGKIGYLPQQSTAGADFPASVKETVLSGCLGALGWRPFYGRAEKEKAERVMKRLGVWEWRERSFSRLSGGQKQRVLLARALCAGENLLLLDEPITGLDPLVTQELYQLIDQAHREEGWTVLMVSHDVKTAVTVADKILHLGKTVRFFGTSEAYLASDLGIHFTGRCCEHV